MPSVHPSKSSADPTDTILVTDASGNIFNVPASALGGQAGTTGGYVAPPVYSNSSGEAGQYSWDADYFYICIAEDSWDRFPVSRAGWNTSTPDNAVILSSSTNADGDELTIVFDRVMSKGDGYSDSDFNIDASSTGNDIGISNVSGSGTNTWVFSIASTLDDGETVTLDFIGRTDGAVDENGNDLLEISDQAVTNNTIDRYDDIIFWAGFEGGITGTTYLGTENDYPKNHVGIINAYVYYSSAHKMVGTKSLWVNSANQVSAKITFALDTPISEAAGRVGFWARMGANYKDFFALRDSDWAGSGGVPVLRLTHWNANQVSLMRGYFGGPAVNDTDPYDNQFIATNPTAILNTFVFYEVAWDYYSFGTKILANGQLISAATYTPKWPWTREYDQVMIGAWNSNGCVNYYDNFMISTDPNRDLYALALLEACPRTE